MKYLITGGTGFIGSNILNRLIRKTGQFNLNDTFVITGRDNENSEFYLIPSFPGCTEQPIVTSVKDRIEDISWKDMGHFDIVFHQAANNDTQCQDADAMVKTNFKTSVKLFEELSWDKFIYASSTAVYGNEPCPYRENETWINPLTPYGESKALFDEYIKDRIPEINKTIIGLRYCNVYGLGESHKQHRMSMIGQIIKQSSNGKKVKLFEHGEQKRDWIYVKDVVSANLLAAKMGPSKSGIYNCGTGIATSFNTIVELISKHSGIEIDVEFIRNQIENTYQNQTLCDISLIKEKLGFEPAYSINEGIKEYSEALHELPMFD